MFFLIMLSTVLFFFCLYLFLDNKIIKKKIDKLESELKTILDKKIQNNVEDSVSIDNISTNIIKPNTQEEATTKKEKTTKIIKEPLEQPSDLLEKVPYVARTNYEEEVPEFKKPTATSLETEKYIDTVDLEQPIEKVNTITMDNLEKPNNLDINASKSVSSEVKIPLEDVSLTEPSTFTEKQPVIPNITLTDDFDPTDFVKMSSTKAIASKLESKSTTPPVELDSIVSTVKSELITPAVEPEPVHPKSEPKAPVVSNDYLQELTNNLTEEIPPQTVELTGYEKIQEEQAVISYQELLSLKEKLKNQDKQDKQFIETLKEIRRLLDSNT